VLVAVTVTVAVRVGEGVVVGVGVVCAAFAALSERIERIRIAKAMILLTDLSCHSAYHPPRRDLSYHNGFQPQESIGNCHKITSTKHFIS